MVIGLSHTKMYLIMMCAELARNIKEQIESDSILVILDDRLLNTSFNERCPPLSNRKVGIQFKRVLKR